MTPRPTNVRLRAYKVGFGDCLLLTVTYSAALDDGRRERHMLIDCGTVSKADKGPSLVKIAEQIAQDCDPHVVGVDPQLDVVVATHRHRDHVGGFGNAGARDILDKLRPRVIIRPWTDVPESVRTDPGIGLDADEQQFLGVLDKLHTQAESVSLLAFDNAKVAKRAAVLAELGFSNAQAIALLEDWGSAGRACYVKAGDPVDITTEMPGVKVQVLGPPTISDVPTLTRYAKESEEYWLAMAAADGLTELVAQGSPESRAKARKVLADPGGVGAAEWLLRQLHERRLAQGLEIVEALDDVLNNTRVILLVTIGSRRLLLPGDAQAENWSLTLDQVEGRKPRKRDARLASELSKVDLYKVGHHGSLNATPKRLTRHWEATAAPGQVVSLLTTRHGVFDKSAEGAVPKQELIEGLGKLGPVHSTDELATDVWWMDLEAPARGAGSFTCTPGPSMA